MTKKITTLDDISSEQWEDYAKTAKISVPEAKKQLKAFLDEYGAERHQLFQRLRSSMVSFRFYQESPQRLEIDEDFDFTYVFVTARLNVKGHFTSLNDFRFRVSYSIDIFGNNVKKESIEISNSDAEYSNEVSFLGNGVRYAFGVRPHDRHGDVYIQGTAYTIFGDIGSFDFTLIHLSSFPLSDNPFIHGVLRPES